MSDNIVIGIAIEGVPGPSGVLQRVIAFGGTLPTSATYEWTRGLTRIPEDFSSTSVDPFEGTWQTSSSTFEVSANDDYAGLLMSEERFPARTLSTALDDTETSVSVSTTVTGGELHIGDEAMRIISGSNPYTVERGAFGSTAQAHDAGTFAGERVGYWVPREIAVVYYDLAADEEWVEWRGYIDDVSMVNAVIAIACTEFYQRWSQAEANKTPQNLNAGGEWRQRQGVRIIGAAPYTSTTTVFTSDVPIQIGQAIVLARWLPVVAGGERFFKDAVGSSTLYGGELDFGDAVVAVYPGPIWELLLWDAALDLAPDMSVTGDARFHPLRICLALLGQDDLQDIWTVKLPVDVAAFEAEIAATPGLRVDRYVLGLDGESYRPFEEVERLMRLFGYSPSITTEGGYSVKRLKVLDLATYQRVSGAPLSIYRDLPLGREGSAASGASAIEVQVGGILPWEQGRNATVSAVGGSRRAQLITERETTSYDASFLLPSRVLSVARQLADSAAMIHYGLPRLKVLVADHRRTGADYDLLAEVQINDLGSLVTPWWVDRNGDRIADLTGRIDAIGVVVERRLHAKTRNYELTLLLVAFGTGQYARERAPAAVVDSASGAIATCANDLHASEASYFTAGDEVSLWLRDGEVDAPGPYTITAISGDDMTLSGASGVLTAGHIIRLAASSSYANDTRYSLTDRPYVYFADANDTIARPASGEDEADIYGGGLGVSY